MLAWRVAFLGWGLVAIAATAGPVRAGDAPDWDTERPVPARRAPSGSWRPSQPGGNAAARRDPEATGSDRTDRVADRTTEEPPPVRRVPRPRRPPEVPAADGIDGAARRFDDAMRRSRQIDQEVAEARRRLSEARVDTVRNYDAQGYLQPTSRRVDGQKVFALIGREGKPVAYLDIPPGIPTAPLVSRRVGVRGPVRFNEGLGTRLIHVSDLEPLDLDDVEPIQVESPSPTARPGPASPERSDRRR